MTAEVTTSELHVALDRVAAEILELAEQFAPPVNTLQLAIRLGFRVAWDERQAGRARIVRPLRGSNLGAATILLRPEPRLERRHWAVAHEIGEAWAWRLFELLGQDPRRQPALREELANLLAGRVLLPSAWFVAAGEEHDWDLLALKRRFETASHELIARRMLDFSTPVAITIFDQGSMAIRRSNLTGTLPRWSPLEEACRQEAFCQAAPIDRGRRQGSRCASRLAAE